MREGVGELLSHEQLKRELPKYPGVFLKGGPGKFCAPSLYNAYIMHVFTE